MLFGLPAKPPLPEWRAEENKGWPISGESWVLQAFSMKKLRRSGREVGGKGTPQSLVN